MKPTILKISLIFSLGILFSCNNHINKDNGNDRHRNNENMERDKTDYDGDTMNFDDRQQDSLKLDTDSV